MSWVDHKSVHAALAACASCIAAGFAAGPALAGPRVIISSSASHETIRIYSAKIRAAADTPPTTYTVRSRPNSTGTRITLQGLSIRGLLWISGFDPDAVDHISIIRPDGSQATLKRSDFADPPPFSEGPALIADEHGGTRYLRPVRGTGDTNAHDSFVVPTALDVTVGGGVLLAVDATPSPRRTSTKRAVAFGARVRFPPAGATLSYTWTFGDGTQGFGAHVTHRYARDGEFQARVTATGSGGSSEACSQTCGGTATVSVRVGTPRRTPRPATTQGAGGGRSAGAGSGGSGSGGGGSGAASGGGTGGGSGSSKPPTARAPHPHAERAARGSAGDPITGILLAGSGTARASSLPALGPGGAKTERAASAGSNGGGTLGGSIALTLLLIVLGALHERRGGRLRVA